MQSVSVEIAEKKGLDKSKAGLIGLIPVLFLLLNIIFSNKPGFVTLLFNLLTYLIPVANLCYFLFAPSKKKVHKSSIRMAFSKKEIFIKFFTYSELLFAAVIVVIPIIYIIGASLSPRPSLPTSIWPEKISLINFTNLIWGEVGPSTARNPIYIQGEFLTNLKSLIWGADKYGNVLDTTLKNLFNISHRSEFVKWYFNTLGIALVNMVVGVIFITGAAYVFARFKFKGKKFGLISILVLQVFPSFMGMVAMYTLFQTFGLMGKPLALSILYIGGAVPYNMWVIKGFLQNIPKELDESAMIDGANKLQIFFKIILPLSVPIISFVGVSLFMAPWMDYMLPKLLLNVDTKDTWTIAMGLYEFISGTNSQYTKFAAGSVIIALPITILYMAFQRFLVEGITAGSTKG
jgi:arabinogalactan oligomer/maltooligosaccharide transport system permease protein